VWSLVLISNDGFGVCVVAESGVEHLVKKARTMATESSMKDAFSTYADYLNNFVSFFLCSMVSPGFICLFIKIEPLRHGIESFR